MTLEGVRARLRSAAILLDFDGSLSPIVERPEDARPEPGAKEALRALAPVVRLLAVVTGRPAAFATLALGLPGLRVEGLYGLEGAAPLASEVHSRVAELIAGVPGAVAEDKGVSLAVHVRRCPDPDATTERLLAPLTVIAADHGLVLLHGKRVMELAPPGGSKGDVVRRLIDEAQPDAVLYAGDDVADLDAFDALDEAAGSGLVTAKVAVRGAETPAELGDMADVLVDGPAGLVALLRGLAGEPPGGGEVS